MLPTPYSLLPTPLINRSIPLCFLLDITPNLPLEQLSDLIQNWSEMAGLVLNMSQRKEWGKQTQSLNIRQVSWLFLN